MLVGWAQVGHESQVELDKQEERNIANQQETQHRQSWNKFSQQEGKNFFFQGIGDQNKKDRYARAIQPEQEEIENDKWRDTDADVPVENGSLKIPRI